MDEEDLQHIISQDDDEKKAQPENNQVKCVENSNNWF